MQGDLKMINIETHDFIEDDDFQAFLDLKLNGKKVSQNKFYRILGKAKQEYTNMKNGVRITVNDLRSHIKQS